MNSVDVIPQIEAMRMGVEYSFPVNLRKFTCSMRPLSNSEMTKCYGEVNSFMRTLPESKRTKVAEDSYLAREFIKHASSPFEMWAPQISDVMLDRMSNDEIMFIYKEWQAICDKVNPCLELMPTESIKELVEDIKKNTPADLDYQLTELSFGQIRSILLYLLTRSD